MKIIHNIKNPKIGDLILDPKKGVLVYDGNKWLPACQSPIEIKKIYI